MEYNTGAIRKLLQEAFDDERFSEFCYDYFRVVYYQFTTGQLRSSRIQALMEFVERHGRMEELLTHIREESPYQYQRYEKDLRKALPSLSPEEPLPAPEPFFEQQSTLSEQTSLVQSSQEDDEPNVLLGQAHGSPHLPPSSSDATSGKPVVQIETPQGRQELGETTEQTLIEEEIQPQILVASKLSEGQLDTQLLPSQEGETTVQRGTRGCCASRTGVVVILVLVFAFALSKGRWLAVPCNSLFSVGLPVETNGAQKIIFSASGHFDDYDIYVMNTDGTHPTRLTYAPGKDRDPAWSPDNQRIAFESSRDGTEEIYVMNADGTHPTRLTYGPGVKYDPAWSPDSQRIAFSKQSHEVGSGIYVMNADGSQPTRLTKDFDAEPTWSPNGQRIAFSRGTEIYVMNVDGTGLTNLTKNDGRDESPAWSPDGQCIAFSSDRDIYVMNADGSGQTRLTRNSWNNWDPAWSPDSRRVAFISRVNHKEDIFVMNLNGSEPTNITKTSLVNINYAGPEWHVSFNPAELGR